MDAGWKSAFKKILYRSWSKSKHFSSQWVLLRCTYSQYMSSYLRENYHHLTKLYQSFPVLPLGWCIFFELMDFYILSFFLVLKSTCVILSVFLNPPVFSYFSCTLAFLVSIFSILLHNLNTFPNRKWVNRLCRENIYSEMNKMYNHLK